MTVIAYSRKHKTLASDSLLSDDNTRIKITSTRKIFRLANGAMVGTAGDEDWREVRALLEAATPRKMPSGDALAGTKTDFLGIMVFPKGDTFIIESSYDGETTQEWTGGVIRVREKFIAVGHGAELATGAMEGGANPREAVRAACKHDTSCALPVQWEKL